MKVVIAGGTGFLGQPLAQTLAADGREVVVLTRGGQLRANRTRERRNRDCGSSPGIPRRGGSWAAEVEGAAVVNLAGESIGARALVGRAEAAHRREPRAGHAQPGPGDPRRHAACGRPDQRIRGRILRAASRRSRARGPRRRDRTFWRGSVSSGNLKRSKASAARRGWPAFERAWRSKKTAARCRAC